MIKTMTTDQNTGLTLSDFAAVINIIDVCTERGAFKGNELLTIGTIRERFAAFVKTNAPQDVSNSEAQDESQGVAQ
jgi:hypothetical protein